MCHLFSAVIREKGTCWNFRTHSNKKNRLKLKHNNRHQPPKLKGVHLWNMDRPNLAQCPTHTCKGNNSRTTRFWSRSHSTRKVHVKITINAIRLAVNEKYAKTWLILHKLFYISYYFIWNLLGRHLDTVKPIFT